MTKINQFDDPTPPNATKQAIKACSDWLIYCIEIGWSKKDLDMLQLLWWQYRNHRGELISDIKHQKRQK